MLNDAIDEVPYIADPVEIGKGGFATVHRATDQLADRLVAVKLLSVRTENGDLKYFDRERESLARLSTHPNVVTLHRTGVTTGGVPYLVMELATGGSLSDRLKTDGPFPWAEAVRWVIPVCNAVEHAHDQGIRHRDIKPQNILISAHGEPLLSDFGIAGMTSVTETITQKIKLSLSYASPEQVDGREVDDGTDIYSLGATLYTLIAGTPAFADTSGAGLLTKAKRIIEDPPPPLDESVPVEIRNAIAAAMAKNPAYRPTIAEFRRALQGENVLDAPPPGDELPAITQEIEIPAQVVEPPILASDVDDWATTNPGPTEDEDDAADGVTRRKFAGLLSLSGRTMSLVIIGLLLTTGLITAAWAGRGGSSNAGGIPTDESRDRTLSAVRSSADDDRELDINNGSGSEQVGQIRSSDSSDDASSTTSTVASSTTTTVPDSDGDGVLDADDNCRDLANPDQRDGDGDGLGDVCDADDDNDEVPDESDNCPADANGAQADIDEDGLGDACDDFPDRDGDGIIDSDDPCVELPEDVDSDGDGTPDKCDETPRGMTVVAAQAQVDRVTILDQDGDGEPDMFGDLTVAGEKFGLPEIPNTSEVRPSNWASDRVGVEPGSPFVRIRVWIRDESGLCLFCKDKLVDITPESGMNALHLVVDTQTGAVDLANDDWNRIGNVGTLTGPSDGDLTGTITQVGDDSGVHLAEADVTVTLVREPTP